MPDFFLTYNFFTLALLFTLPGIGIGAARPDLRQAMWRAIPFSLPFACTEFLFYPLYWEPVFLFDLGRRIGFGIEDVLFVTGLAAFTTTAYAAACNRTYAPRGCTSARACCLRALGLLALAAALLVLLLSLGVPVIYGACAVMGATGLCVVMLRRDLIRPALIGGGVSAAVYFVLCLVAGALMPGIFINTWHAQRFSNIYMAGVPLEELLYGVSSGSIATAFYPYVFGCRFVSRRRESAV